MHSETSSIKKTEIIYPLQKRNIEMHSKRLVLKNHHFVIKKMVCLKKRKWYLNEKAVKSMIEDGKMMWHQEKIQNTQWHTYECFLMLIKYRDSIARAYFHRKKKTVESSKCESSFVFWGQRTLCKQQQSFSHELNSKNELLSEVK